ncbi:MAG: cytochrome c3 family protein [Deltaproteobacteria bacterium]|nr:cytochrome c3 family protein [Deltaproteobacteria bacterium]MBW2070860.1 cytochrome c3 family protein [Deltaproteobacteria bacterium]
MSGEHTQRESGALGWTLFVVGFVGALFVGWVVFPKLLYSTQQQPLNFNHAVHMENDMACEDCHGFREDGSYVGIPQVEKCAECHEEPMTESEAEAKLVTEFVEPGKEIPWLSYTRQPDNVFFSHAAHVLMAEMECTSCHRDASQEEETPPVQVNRLTGYPKGIMKMYKCEDCHARASVHNGCDVCHK